jgi:hypothetical protein
MSTAFSEAKVRSRSIVLGMVRTLEQVWLYKVGPSCINLSILVAQLYEKGIGYKWDTWWLRDLQVFSSGVTRELVKLEKQVI